jgi:soluble lytic murein transglycosylase
MFPDGEKSDSAHLNIIDAYREAGKYDDANRWVDRTVTDFAGTPTEANAIQARIRMEIFRKNWPAAVKAADALHSVGSLRGSMASTDEAKYLKAFALERSGKRSEAMVIYGLIDNASYFGDLADKRTKGDTTVGSGSATLYDSYPVKFHFDLVKQAKKHKIDPRFLLAIMKQESSFRANAKSPAGARGLLQLVFDTAIKYKDEAGYPNLKPDDLYSSSTNIAIGSVYVSKLKDEFDGMYEAIASSYNAGEDNTARWLARTSPKDPGIFASEVGFAETKNYVFKVMNNYRMYRMLYDENLNRR